VLVIMPVVLQQRLFVDCAPQGAITTSESAARIWWLERLGPWLLRVPRTAPFHRLFSQHIRSLKVAQLCLAHPAALPLRRSG